MSWGAVAIAGAAVVSSVVSSNSAKKASKSAAKSASNELEFNQQQYDDWQNVYGPIQDNLSDYYSTLTPDYYATMGLEAFEKERSQAEQDLQSNLAQRGISPSSGLAMQLETNLDTQAAEKRADIRRAAPAMVAQDQQNFLAIGMGRNPAANVSNTLANQSNVAANTANAANTAAGTSWGNTLNTVFQEGGAGNKFITGLSSSNTQQSPAPITQAVGTPTGR